MCFHRRIAFLSHFPQLTDLAKKLPIAVRMTCMFGGNNLFKQECQGLKSLETSEFIGVWGLALKEYLARSFYLSQKFWEPHIVDAID